MQLVDFSKEKAKESFVICAEDVNGVTIEYIKKIGHVKGND